MSRSRAALAGAVGAAAVGVGVAVVRRGASPSVDRRSGTTPVGGPTSAGHQEGPTRRGRAPEARTPVGGRPVVVPARPALSVARARAVARSGSLSESLLGLLAVLITLLLGGRDEVVVEVPTPDADDATPGPAGGGVA